MYVLEDRRRPAQDFPPTAAKLERPKSKSLQPCRCNYDGCGKMFSKRSNLKAHTRVHNGTLPYLCYIPGCNKRFRWKSSLKPHVRVHFSSPFAQFRPSPFAPSMTRCLSETTSSCHPSSERLPNTSTSAQGKLAFQPEYEALQESDAQMSMRNALNAHCDFDVPFTVHDSARTGLDSQQPVSQSVFENSRDQYGSIDCKGRSLSTDSVVSISSCDGTACTTLTLNAGLGDEENCEGNDVDGANRSIQFANSFEEPPLLEEEQQDLVSSSGMKALGSAFARRYATDIMNGDCSDVYMTNTDITDAEWIFSENESIFQNSIWPLPNAYRRS